MSIDLKHSISELLRESRSFNKNDVLVHADTSNGRLFFADALGTLQREDFPASILKEARKTMKESGVNPLCQATGFLLSDDGSTRSPIVLIPVKVKEDRVRAEISFKAMENEAFLNPYVEFLLQELQVAYDTMDVENAPEFLKEKGFEVAAEDGTCIGNFHHHRYSVLRELEELLQTASFSNPLRSVLGEKKDETSFTLPNNILFSADVDHERVFARVQETSLVVQGPPGTGKSQVLSNLIGKLLAAQRSALVLSEKRVALEVIQQKLNAFGLDRLGYVATSDNEVHDFLQELQENWHFFEQLEVEPSINLQLSEQYENQLQFTLDVLNQPDAVGGISLYDFKKWMQDIPMETPVFVSHPPSVPEYKKQRDTIAFAYQKDLTSALELLKTGTLKRYDFEPLLPDIRSWMEELESLHRVVPFETWEDFIQLMHLAGWCQVLENARRKQQEHLFKPNSRAQKKFQKLFREYTSIKSQLEQLPFESHWLTKPGREDIAYLKKLHQKQSFLGQRKFRQVWKTYSRLPPTEAPDAFAAFSKKMSLEDKKSSVLTEFCDFNILEGEKEAKILHFSVGVFQEKQWEETQKINAKTRQLLTDYHNRLNTLYSDLNTSLQLKENTQLLTRLRSLESNFPELVAHQKAFAQLDSNTLALLGMCPTFASFESSIAFSHWTLFEKRFPAFSAFELSDIHTKVTSIVATHKQEASLFANTILTSVREQFAAYHQLLSTPARKLTDEEKAHKQRLRKGKSILVKEFAKTRSHPTMRELFASEARDWIQVLKPIWLSNPTQIAKAFPLEEGLFDTVIFDEASQVPLQNALGALQRSTHGVIAGDSQQMGPTSYFQSGRSEVVDVLHQASFHWENVHLNHHYRSVHPSLIAFSNKHFYGGNLQAYPAFDVQTPIRHIQVENGVFDARRNEVEAEQIAQHIKTLITGKDSIGIVAFSEEQLQCIREKLDAKTEQTLAERQENGTAFFKALENVQGDECDHLIIGFGYARDPEGNFAMRFGPMNTTNGRRRLNVLLTRARKKMDWFSSVTAADFKMSDNESLDLLRHWFLHLESLEKTDTLRLPFNLPFTTDGNVLTLIEGHKHLREAREFVTFQEVMEARGWTVQYT